MSDIIEKVKEKTKDVKDKVIDNTKDVIGAAKESFSAQSESSSSITPSPTFTSSSSVTYVPNPEKNNSEIGSKKVDSPLIQHSESEQKIFSTNIKENNEIRNTNYDSVVTGNLQIDKQKKQQYEYNQNNEYFDPITISIKLWQNYYITWMNFYTGLLESFNRTSRNI
jgi:hypothetical protein